jgi:cytochrome c biogenesis protein
MSVTRNRPEERPNPPRRSLVANILQFLSSIRFAILVLSFIAASSVVGTLIKQQASPQEYLQRFSEDTYAVLRFFRLTDVFHAPWFIFLIGLLVLNVVFCTTNRFTRFLKGRKEVKIPAREIVAGMENNLLLPNRNLHEVAGTLKGYKKTTGNDAACILEKGRLSRYGVYLIHSSIVVILIGSLVGMVFGYRGFVNLGKGEASDHIRDKGKKKKAIPLGFTIQCSDFRIAYYPTGEPKEYVSRLRVVNNGNVVREADVRVNHPLTYRGTSIYQASYGNDPFFVFDIGGEQVKLTEGEVYKRNDLTLMVIGHERSIHSFGPGVQVVYLDKKGPKTAWFLSDVPDRRERQITGVPVRLSEIGDEFYTGLEVSYDPGVWIVWVGFAMILFGLYANFFVHYRRIYLIQTAEGLLVAGVALRNREAFREEFEGLWRKLNDGR